MKMPLPPQPETPSIADRIQPVAAGDAVVGIGALGRNFAFALAGGEVVLAGDISERIAAHDDAGILEAASDGRRFITAGDDGRLVETRADGSTQVLADTKGRWIDHVAIAGDGTVAYSSGKSAYVLGAKGEVKRLDVPSTVGGLAFAPKGLRLAITHYNGVTLWFPATQAAPDVLEWKGSHLAVMFSPDGRFLVTSMQEATLHGWRLADKANMRMSGYPARVRSMSWTVGGEGLATSGAAEVIVWPFTDKNGPMGKPPAMFAALSQLWTCVAGHPKEPIVAVGAKDGLILLVRLKDGAEILVRKPAGGEISALAWTADGSKLAFGTEDGEAGIVPL